MLDVKEVDLKLGDYENYLENALEVKPLTKTGSVVRYIGIDMGSTANRIVPYKPDVEDENELFGRAIEVSSTTGVVGDISHIRSNSNKLYDNMEIVIKDMSVPDKKDDKVFDEVHIVKYGLHNSVTSQTFSTPSGVSKVDLDVTYINAISAMAIDILESSLNHGTTYSCYRVNPSASLPPEDFMSSIIINKFKRKLAGHYEINFPRLGVHFNILIELDEIFTDKEPNAVVFNLASEYEDIQEVTSIALDGGGKSTDVSLVVDGVLVERGSDTMRFGGAKLLDEIAIEYKRVKGKNAPPSDSILKALDNGVLVRGKNEEDIMEIIVAAKNTMANNIYNELLKIIDRASVSIDDIGFIAFHGRLFKDTISTTSGEDKPFVANVADMLLKLLHKTNSSIEFCKVSDTATIAQGIIISNLIDGE